MQWINIKSEGSRSWKYRILNSDKCVFVRVMKISCLWQFVFLVHITGFVDLTYWLFRREADLLHMRLKGLNNQIHSMKTTYNCVFLPKVYSLWTLQTGETANNYPLDALQNSSSSIIIPSTIRQKSVLVGLFHFPKHKIYRPLNFLREQIFS